MNANLKHWVAAAALTTAAMAQAQQIAVQVDGKPVNFRSGGPKFYEGRVMVPLRGVFEQMGAEVMWRPANRVVMARKGDREVRLVVGDRFATVDGREVRMDVPAIIQNGNTLVPIRFLSETLGADVRWNSADMVVMIDTISNAGGRAGRIYRDLDDPTQQRDWDDQDRTNTSLSADTVLPMRLDTPLSSNESRKGDRFTATLRTTGSNSYAGLPDGTRVEGRVVTAKPRRGEEPGILELEFQRLRLPSGRAIPIDGQLISLEDKSLERSDSGELRAPTSARKENRNVYAGYGAGAGLIIGLLTKKPIEGAVLGGILGYLAGQAQTNKNDPRDVRLASGSEFGVRINETVALNRG